MAGARRLRRRRFLAGGLASAGLLAAGAACRRSNSSAGQASSTRPSGASAGTPKPGGTVLVSLSTNPLTWDSNRTTAGYTTNPLSSVASRLTRYVTGPDPRTAENHEVEGDLALSMESPDGITWTVKLRPDATFGDVPPVNGHAVEADDIKATFVRATAPDSPNRGALALIDPDQIQTPARDTVIFKLKYPYAAFKTVTASTLYSWIYPREVLSGGYDPAKTMIGSGPFLFDSFQPDVAVAVHRRDGWFEKGRPYVDGIRWSVIVDTQQALAQFTAGHLDVLGPQSQVPTPSGLAAFEQANPKATVLQRQPTVGNAAFFQLKPDSNSPFQDIRLRRAVSLAIDRDAIKKAVYNDDGEAAFTVAPNLGKWALTQSSLDPSITQYYKYDPAAAKTLLDAAGMSDKQWKFVYATGFLGPTYAAAAQAIGNMLSAAGFKITTVTADFTKDFQNNGKGYRYGNFATDMIIFAAIAPYEDVDPFMANYFSSLSPNTMTGVQDSTLDQNLTKARAIINEDERLKAYLDIQKYLADKMYAVNGLPSPHAYDFVQPWLQNYQMDSSYAFATETLSKVWLTRS
jgi:peptide/nickel transport system substrate-binding protein